MLKKLGICLAIIAICFISNKGPHLDTLKMAQKNAIVLLKTKFAMFDACGRLYKAGLSGCDEKPNE